MKRKITVREFNAMADARMNAFEANEFIHAVEWDSANAWFLNENLQRAYGEIEETANNHDDFVLEWDDAPPNHEKALYEMAVENMKEKSTQPGYKGCTVHLCAIIRMHDGYPQIVGYKESDWFDDSVVASFCNGQQTN